jgi:hypothetical protein
MKNCVQRFFLFSAVTSLAIAISGCSACKPGKTGPPGKYNIQVSLDESLKQASVPVDLVGVNLGSLSRYQTYSMTDYWKPRDLLRTDADKVEFVFGGGQPLTRTLDTKNPKWDQWKRKGVTHVFVLAYPPGGHPDKEGAQDARRQVLPLDMCAWEEDTETLSVVVKRSGIDILTPPRAGK